MLTKQFAGNHWKTVPQGLKPSPIAHSTARLKPCPSSSESFRGLFKPWRECPKNFRGGQARTVRARKPVPFIQDPIGCMVTDGVTSRGEDYCARVEP
jgi:hypothetical protein